MSARRRRPVLAGALVATGTLLPVVFGATLLLSGRDRLAMSLDAALLLRVIVVGALAVAARVAAVIELAVVAPRPIGRPAAAACSVAIGVCVAMAFGIVQVGRARASIGDVFRPSDRPLYEATAPDTSVATTTTTAPVVTTPPTTEPEVLGTVVTIAPPTTTTTTTTPPAPGRPSSGFDPAVFAGVSNVLLLGGDAGPGRYGLRTDTMMILSLHRPSGRASLVSVPRNLNRLRFPPASAMADRYPGGFTDIANAVYQAVTSSPTLRDAYGTDGVPPGVAALAEGIGYSFDVTIDDYVLVDMQGFLDLVDALGGVTVDVRSATPMPGNVPGARTRYPSTIGPGIVHMDGTTALGYVRSRSRDSDDERTARQRDLLAALARQVSFDDVISSFEAVASAVGGTVRTSLTPDELTDLLEVIGGETAIVESVGLVPPLISVNHPDLDRAATIVGEVRLALVSGRPSGH